MLLSEGSREQPLILLIIRSRGIDDAFLLASVGVSVISGISRHLVYRQIYEGVNAAKTSCFQRFFVSSLGAPAPMYFA